jgi:uncharacterized membrane protein YhhN
MAMVYCRGCGKEIHETAPMCPHCGFVQMPTTSAMEVQSAKTSIWMAVTAFVSSVIQTANWFHIDTWNKDLKVGLWIFLIVSITFATISLQQNRKGKILAGISIAVSVITFLLLLN